MLIKVQGVWEAERMAHCLKVYYSIQPTSKYKDWALDIAERIERQAQKEKERRHGSENNVRDN